MRNTAEVVNLTKKTMDISKAAVLLVMIFTGLGQVSMGQEEVKQYKLTFKNFPEVGPGQYSPVEGTVGSVGHEFYMDGLDVLQPLAIVLQAEDSSANLQLQLRSYSWAGSLREKATDNEGRAIFRVRSTEDLYARVVSPEETEESYQLVVWKGEPITVDQVAEEFRPVVVPESEYEGDENSSSMLTLPWIWIALLAISGLIITFFIRRREKV